MQMQFAQVLSPGQMGLAFWHNPLFEVVMDGRMIAAGLVCVILAGLVAADLVSTTISTDGSVMISTSGGDENHSFASRALALDTSRVNRMVETGEDTVSDLIIRSQGPALFSEYGVSVMNGPDVSSRCAFVDLPRTRESDRISQYVSGILQHGEVDTSQKLSTTISGMTTVNGTGMVLLGSDKQGNQTFTSRAFISGNMSVSDLVRMGARF